MNNPKLDQYTQILHKRIHNYMNPGVVSASHVRRMQAYQIIDHYLCADSVHALRELPDSLRQWWTDPGTLKMFAGVFAKLTTKGMRLNSSNDLPPERKAALLDWTRRSKLYRVLRQSCRDASAYGDAVLQPVWDNALGCPRLDVLHPGWYVPINENRVLLMWQPDIEVDELVVQDYLLGTSGILDGDKVRMTGELKVGMRTVKIRINTIGSNRSVLDYLTGQYEPLPYSRIPVVHIANGEYGGNGFGTSDFSTALDVMDNYHQLLTDKRRQSRFMIPPIGVRGNVRFAAPSSDGVVRAQYEPGMFVGLGENGGFDMPDFSPLLTAATAEKDDVRAELLRACGLTKAALGELGDVSNLRELEIRMIFAPIDNEVQDRRQDFITPWRDAIRMTEELWKCQDMDGYTKVFGNESLADMDLLFDEVMPKDVATLINTLTASRGALDQETYTREIMAARGISGDPAAVAAKVAEEGKGTALGF
jgi:hypothetical protein